MIIATMAFQQELMPPTYRFMYNETNDVHLNMYIPDKIVGAEAPLVMYVC